MKRFTVLTDEHMTIYDMANELDMLHNNMTALISKRTHFPKQVGVIRGKCRDLRVYNRGE